MGMNLFIIGGLLTGLYTYFMLPVFSIGFYDVVGVLIIWFFIFSIGFARKEIEKIKIPISFIVIIMMLLVVIPFITSFAGFHSKAYQSLLGNVTESDFSANISPIDNSQIRLIDQSTAKKLADQKIGSMGSNGSVVEMGELVLQKVQGKLYYIAPLEHRGFWQWSDYGAKGTPGYIMVSATNINDIKLVNEINGKPIFIKYQPNAYFGDDLQRHLYFNGYMTKGMADYTFEVDDNLVPYWVVTIYDKKIGYEGEDAIGVAVVNAQTGEIKSYGLNDLPEWIDRVQPERFIVDQITDWGKFVGGYFNSKFSKTGTLKPSSDSMHLTYGSDGQCYWYVGITSTASDESTVGFMLVNSRTKEAKFIKIAGKQEPASKRSADAVGKPYFMTSGDIILYNIAGVPTYITPMKNTENLTSGVALIYVEDYNIVGFGKDIDSAIMNYKQNLMSKGNAIAPDFNVKHEQIQSTVLRINSAVRDGLTYYYLTIKDKNQIFVGSTMISDKLPLTQAGDTIIIKYDETKDRKVSISEFDNLNVLPNGVVSPQQIEKEKSVKEVYDNRELQQDVKVFNNEINKLTPQEKANLLKTIQK